MPPTAVAAFVKKWFDIVSPPKAEEPRLVRMPPQRYLEMLNEWETTLEAHVPSASDHGEETLNSVLYMLNVTLRVTEPEDSIGETAD